MSAKTAARVYGVILGVCIAVGILSALSALANQTSLTVGGAANASASCSFANATAQAIAYTGTAAKTTAATGTGGVRLVCTTAAHFVQGATGVSGITAVTGSTYIPADTPEYVQGNNSWFSFVRETSSGTCYVTECQ